MDEECAIQLVPMHQLSEAKDFWQDDWTGLADSGARRKRQSRLSKRAQRRRKMTENKCSPHKAFDGACTSSRPRQMSVRGIDNNTQEGKFTALQRARSLAIYDAVASNKLDLAWLATDICHSLPADHLLTLIQFNAYRAILINVELLAPLYKSVVAQGYLEADIPGVPSAKISLLVGQSLPVVPKDIPSSLAPTPLQKQIPHPSWIDAVPLAALRDNLISDMGNYDEVALCLDTLGCLFHDHVDADYSDRKGLIVWSDPWNASSWELSEGFVRKWGFLLKGCEELLYATNYWRSIRGESQIAFDVCDLPGI